MVVTMLCVSKKKLSRQINVEVPDRLSEDMDELVDKLGLVKKRAVAAAVCAFLQASGADQVAMYHNVYERYYAEESDNDPDDNPGDKENAGVARGSSGRKPEGRSRRRDAG